MKFEVESTYAMRDRLLEVVSNAMSEFYVVFL